MAALDTADRSRLGLRVASRGPERLDFCTFPASPLAPSFVTSQNGRSERVENPGMFNRALALADRRARASSPCHICPPSASDTRGARTPVAAHLSRWAARRACRTPGRAAPRPPRKRRRVSASLGGTHSRRSARPSDSPRRGARHWSFGRAQSAWKGRTPISSVRAAKARGANRPGRPRGKRRTMTRA